MAKIWVDIVASVSPDGEEAKKALTKSVKDKVEKGMVTTTAANLPDKFSSKASDKPKDKRDDYAARAVRIIETLKLTIETKGPKVSMGGALQVGLELLDLKSDKGHQAAGGFGSKAAGIERRGTIDKQFEALCTQLMEDLVAPAAAKALTSSNFVNHAKQMNLPI
jgi:hypothetical protein